MNVEQIAQVQKLNNQSLDAAKIVIAMIPVLAVYPFLQKYFVSGITLGSVKVKVVVISGRLCRRK